MKKFDPFNDRLSRDIRNDLSEGFALALQQRDIAPAERSAERYLNRDLADAYAAYISQRLERYRTVLERIVQEKREGEFEQAVVLWNHGLFFEFHEFLEVIWLRERGARKKILQALIRAAGVYILRDFKEAGARKMAAKARAGLQEHRQALPTEFDCDRLLAALENVNVSPPTF